MAMAMQSLPGEGENCARTGWTGFTGRCWMMCCVTAETSSRRTQCRLLVCCSVTLDGDGCSRRGFDSTASRACAQAQVGLRDIFRDRVRVRIRLRIHSLHARAPYAYVGICGCELLPGWRQRLMYECGAEYDLTVQPLLRPSMGSHCEFRMCGHVPSKIARLQNCEPGHKVLVRTRAVRIWGRKQSIGRENLLN